MPTHKHSLLYGQLGPWLTVTDDYQVGEDVQVTVVARIEYGLLVELGSGVVALLHRKEIDWTSVDPIETLRMGEVIDVRILSIDPDRKRMSVSRRALLPNPQDAFMQTVQVGAVYLGTVRKCVDYGAFVEIAPGVRCLLHVSEMAGPNEVASVARKCSIGDCIWVRISNIEHESKRITLAWWTDDINSLSLR